MSLRIGAVVLLSLLSVSAISGGLGAAAEYAGHAGKGKALYANLCIRCHGVEGKGNGVMTFTPPVADLTAPAAQSKLDATLLKTIHDGRKNTAMGAWKFVLTEEEMRDVAAYLRVLGTGANRTFP